MTELKGSGKTLSNKTLWELATDATNPNGDTADKMAAVQALIEGLDDAKGLTDDVILTLNEDGTVNKESLRPDKP